MVHKYPSSPEFFVGLVGLGAIRDLSKSKVLNFKSLVRWL